MHVGPLSGSFRLEVYFYRILNQSKYTVHVDPAWRKYQAIPGSAAWSHMYAPCIVLSQIMKQNIRSTFQG